MLSSYRNATDVAGQYKKVGTNVGGVAAIMVDRSDGYGPSQHMFDSWKRSGIPTSELRQPTTFGMATVKGDTAGDCFTFGKLPQSTPSGKAVSHHAPRVNPITWAGGPEEPAPRRNYDPRTGRAVMEALEPEPPAPAPPPQQPQQPIQMDPNEMQQTWSHLMRTGKVRQSAAQCMVHMPPMYSLEPPPPMPPVNSHAINTIGLHPQNGGRPVRRSTAFTSDFRDPFD